MLFFLNKMRYGIRVHSLELNESGAELVNESERQRIAFNSVESLPSASRATLELICQNSEPITQEPEFETVKVNPPSDEKIEACEVKINKILDNMLRNSFLDKNGNRNILIRN